MNEIGLTARRRLRPRVGGLALVGALGMLWATAPVASAATTVCSNTTLYGNVSGTVSVPAGTYCDLDHATVNGSVTAAAGTNLELYDASTITGSLTTTGATYVEVEENSHVGGTTQINLSPTGSAYLNSSTFAAVTVTGGDSVNVEYNHINGAATFANTVAGNPYCDFVEIYDNHFGGALKVSGNAAPIDVETNSVAGPVSITGNTGGTFAGYFTGGIYYNTSAGALSCSTNGTPFNGSDNHAPIKTGQCSTF
jgi:hypothetical protein